MSEKITERLVVMLGYNFTKQVQGHLHNQGETFSSFARKAITEKMDRYRGIGRERTSLPGIFPWRTA